MTDQYEPGTEVRLISGTTARVVEDLGEPHMVLVETVDGTPVRATRGSLAVAAMQAT
jgi:hypothetical protein